MHLCWPFVAVLTRIEAYFHYVHAFSIIVVHCCMLGAWQNVQVTFFGCVGIKWVPLLEFTLIDLVSHVLDVFNSLCATMPCLAHTVHTLGISRHISCISTCISTCTHMHTLLYSLHSCIVSLFTWLIIFNLLFLYVCSVLHMLWYVLSCCQFCFELTWI